MQKIHMLIGCVIGACALGSGSVAQTTPSRGAVQPPPAPAARTFDFSAGAGFEHQLETDIQGAEGAEFNVSRLNAGLAVSTDLNPDLRLNIRFGYAVHAYDFSGEVLEVGDPWDDIHILAAAAIFSADMTDEFNIFGGPVVQISRESGADWGDSIVGGGVVGGSFRFSDDFTLGGGLGVVNRLEDDDDEVRIFPVIILNWQLTETLRLSSQTLSNASGRTGLELVWSPLKRWEFALGGANETARFRLDDDGVVPGGVGSDESLPVWLRASFAPSASVQISGIAGFVTGGELELEDSDGDRIDKEDYDNAPFFGVFANVRF